METRSLSRFLFVTVSCVTLSIFSRFLFFVTGYAFPIFRRPQKSVTGPKGDGPNGGPNGTDAFFFGAFFQHCSFAGTMWVGADWIPKSP
jgi:hypothetical protein